MWLQICSILAKIPTMLLSKTVSRIKIPFVKGNEIKEFRKRIGISQEELAEYLSVTRITISRWENDHRGVPEYLRLALITVENMVKAKREKSATDN